MDNSRNIQSYINWTYIENPKDSTQKLLEPINEFSEAAGYKTNIQKSVVFFYTGNRESLKVSFKIVSGKYIYI